MSTLLLTDVRTAARSLRHSPTVALSAIACLALGIGATVAIASAIDRALLGRLPFREPDRLVTVYRTTPQFNTGPFSAPNYTDLARESRRLASLAAITPATGDGVIRCARGCTPKRADRRRVPARRGHAARIGSESLRPSSRRSVKDL